MNPKGRWYEPTLLRNDFFFFLRRMKKNLGLESRCSVPVITAMFLFEIQVDPSVAKDRFVFCLTLIALVIAIVPLLFVSRDENKERYSPERSR